MRKTSKSTRRILSAGVGIAAITALGGLACGNPVEPRCPGHGVCVDAGMDAPHDAGGGDAAPQDGGQDATVTEPKP